MSLATNGFDHVNSILSRFENYEIKYVVDSYSDTQWYLGISFEKNSLKSEKKWMIFQISNSGTTTDVNSATNFADDVWNDRLTLNYATLENILLSASDISANTIGFEIATLTTLGGINPITFSITSQDIGDHFEVVGDKLKLKNTVEQNSTKSLTVRATDSTSPTPSFIEKQFTITSSFFLSSKSVYCNGVDQKITITPTAELIAVNDIVSHCFWIKIPLASPFRQILTQKYSTSGYQYLYQMDGSGTKLVANIYGPEGARVKVSTNPISDNQWHFIVITFKASTDEFEMYIDGTKDFAAKGGTIISAIKEYATPTLFLLDNLEAYIDDVAIFSRLLSAAEVLDFYNEGAPKDLSGEAGLLYYAYIGDDVITTSQNAIVGNAGELINLDANTISTDVPQ